MHLLVRTPSSKLQGIHTRFFTYEGPEGLNVEGGITRISQREFILNHPEKDKFQERLGIENSFNLHRVLLTYYNAAYSLNRFWDVYGSKGEKSKALIDFQEEFTLDKLEKLSKMYNVELLNQTTLPYANILVNNEKEYYFETNAFQELLWVMNMDNIFKDKGLQSFDMRKTDDLTPAILQNYDLAIYRMLQKREIAMVFYEWTNVVSYNQPDFIKRISAILELITKDIKKNKTIYLSNNTIEKERDILFDLVNKVNDNNHLKKYFFRLFNASDLLGLYSRHGSSKFQDFVAFNQDEESTIEDIYKLWTENKTIPNLTNFNHLFSFWHLTTTIIVFSWIRLNHTETLTK